MKHTLIVASVLALTLAACAKKEETAQAPAEEAPAAAESTMAPAADAAATTAAPADAAAPADTAAAQK